MNGGHKNADVSQARWEAILTTAIKKGMPVSHWDESASLQWAFVRSEGLWWIESELREDLSENTLEMVDRTDASIRARLTAALTKPINDPIDSAIKEVNDEYIEMYHQLRRQPDREDGIIEKFDLETGKWHATPLNFVRDFIDKDNPGRIQPEEVEVSITRNDAIRLGLVEDNEMENNATFVCSIPIYRCNMANLGVDVVRDSSAALSFS